MNLLLIKQGDGIYVKDYVKHAGIDFLSLLFTQDEADGEDYVIDECLIDEVWEYWMMFFPEMLKLASQRLSLKDLKSLRNLLDEEHANIKNREKSLNWKSNNRIWWWTSATTPSFFCCLILPAR